MSLKLTDRLFFGTKLINPSNNVFFFLGGGQENREQDLVRSKLLHKFNMTFATHLDAEVTVVNLLHSHLKTEGVLKTKLSEEKVCRIVLIFVNFGQLK